jgi:hypothetical protein
MKKLGSLAGSTLLLWGILIYPCWLIWANTVWLESSVALGLCLVPALVTLAWTLRAGDAPEQQLVAVLGGTGVRLVFALGGGLLLYHTLPEMFTNGFWLWLAVFYMFILAVETFLVLNKKQDSLA